MNQKSFIKSFLDSFLNSFTNKPFIILIPLISIDNIGIPIKIPNTIDKIGIFFSSGCSETRQLVNYFPRNSRIEFFSVVY